MTIKQKFQVLQKVKKQKQKVNPNKKFKPDRRFDIKKTNYLSKIASTDG